MDTDMPPPVASLAAYRAKRGLPVSPVQVPDRFDELRPVPTHCPVCGVQLDLRITLGSVARVARNLKDTSTTSHASLLGRVRFRAKQIEYLLAGLCGRTECELELENRDDPRAAARRARRIAKQRKA